MVEQPVDRRTALKTFGTGAAVATGASAGSAAAGQQDSSPVSGQQDSSPAESGESVTGTEATGLYGGTVDRIVDDEHVVVLVEAGGSVIDQHVVPASEHPALDEGDSVSLLVIFGHLVAIWKVPGG